MELSIIIVNYNVRWFITQCLDSVQRAITGISAEVIVVDNHSTDDSVDIIRKFFPTVKCIVNRENTGFSRANNQGIREARGKYVLLLNPDTLVAEDTFAKCLGFMETHPDAGALGVRMIDGRGIFLPESKRGLPTPFTAFCKAFGLSALFPRSKTFNQYHLGYLSEKEIHPVDVLSGAFMWMRREALDKAGLLDEAFFMYGEDIDLSYRIRLAGYQNYYFPETTILHYKGESTKKGSLNYVRVFYGAMEIFARKHFSQSHSSLFQLLIRVAIVFRGLLTFISGLLSPRMLMILDVLFAWGGLIWISHFWADAIKQGENYFPSIFLSMVLPAYSLIWMFFVWLSGGYEKPYRFTPLLQGLGWGTIILLALYGLLPEAWRFSRAVILLGAVWTGVEMLFSRWVHAAITRKPFFLDDKHQIQLVFAGSEGEWGMAKKLIRSQYDRFTFLGLISNTEPCSKPYLCGLSALPQLQRQLLFDEMIISRGALSYSETLHILDLLSGQCSFRIFHPDNDYIIGSDSKNNTGEWMAGRLSTPLHKSHNIRTKRRSDILIGVLLLILLPLLIWSRKRFLLKHIPAVWRGKKTWIGQFPLQPEVTAVLYSKQQLAEPELYAKTYSPQRDYRLIFRFLLSGKE